MSKNYLDKITIADALYDYLVPEIFKVWEGCYEPKNLVKHMAATDVAILTGLHLKRSLSLAEINALEEVTFSVIGFPKCWESDKEIYFFRKENGFLR